MPRKTIALLVSGSVPGVQDSIIEGVRSSCELLDYNLLIFNQLSDYYTIAEWDGKRNIMGECMVFGLIPYDNIDGMIIDSRTFIDENVLKVIIDTARGKEIPVICLDDVQRGCLHIDLDDMSGELTLIRHLIEEHGITRINFIGGMPGNKETENRLAAYKRAIYEHNIPYEPERIGYGYFCEKARDTLQEFMDSKLPFPQAIVCANDYMAVEVSSMLIERGYNVPEDIIVVGFDAFEAAQKFYPSITSVRRGMQDCGELAVKQLSRLWKGKNVPLDTKVVPDIVYGMSCGCVPKSEKQAIKMYYYEHAQYKAKKKLYDDLSTTAHYALGGKNLKEFLERIEVSTSEYTFDALWFCMNEVAKPLELEEGQTICSYGKIYVEGEFRSDKNYLGQRVNEGDILPGFDGSQDEEKPYCYLINPAYVRGYSLGYLVRKYSGSFSYKGYFREWLSVISAFMGTYYFEAEKTIKSMENID